MKYVNSHPTFFESTTTIVTEMFNHCYQERRNPSLTEQGIFQKNGKFRMINCLFIIFIFITIGLWIQCGNVECCKWRYLDYTHDPAEFIDVKWKCSDNQG